jgi:hypothetical protein
MPRQQFCSHRDLTDITESDSSIAIDSHSIIATARDPSRRESARYCFRPESSVTINGKTQFRALDPARNEQVAQRNDSKGISGAPVA